MWVLFFWVGMHIVRLIFPILIILLDQISKFWIVSHTVSLDSFWGGISFRPNFGFASSFFTEADVLLKLCIVLSFFALMLAIVYLINTFFLTNKLFSGLRLSLWCVIASIAGNLIDKIQLGYAVDFLYLNVPFLRNAIFNIADIFLVASVLVCVFWVAKYHKLLWYDNDRRRVKLIDRVFQIKFTLYIVSFTVLLGFLFGSLGLSFLLNSNSDAIWTYILMFSLYMIMISFLSLLLGLILSFRIVGPLKALSNFIDTLEGGEKEISFTLRKGDLLQGSLKKIAQKVKVLILGR